MLGRAMMAAGWHVAADHLANRLGDGLLHAAIGILLVVVAGLDKAHWRADDEFATTRLLVARRERALAQQIKFIFVEASLQPEKQPVIPVPRRIDRLLINQHRIDNAAHLDQLLPVPAVAGEARDLAGTHGADLAETYFCDHALEAGALDAACGRTAEIVVDHLDLGPAECRQAISHGILQRTALAVVQNLMR